MITVFVGDSNSGLADLACEYDSTAFLLDVTNYEDFLTSTKDATVYTSLSDLPKDQKILFDILLVADRVVYAPPQIWSDKKSVDTALVTDPASSLQGSTENILLQAAAFVDIKNINLISSRLLLLDPVDDRKTNDPQLWIAGCSISHGMGVDNNTRYGTLVAKELNMPVSFLTCPGSSIIWQAGQLMLADLKPGDTVVWALTMPNRFPYYHDNKLTHVYPAVYEELFGKPHIIFGIPKIKSTHEPLELGSENLFYQNILAVRSVINYCRALDIKLYIIGLFGLSNLLKFLHTEPSYYNYIDPELLTENMTHKYADLGTDNQHPGIQQHKKYATFVLNCISQSNK